MALGYGLASAEPEQGDVAALADVVPVHLEIQPDPT